MCLICSSAVRSPARKEPRGHGEETARKVIQLQYAAGTRLKQPLVNIPREGRQGDENESPTTGLVQAFLLLQYS